MAIIPGLASSSGQSIKIKQQGKSNVNSNLIISLSISLCRATLNQTVILYVTKGKIAARTGTRKKVRLSKIEEIKVRLLLLTRSKMMPTIQCYFCNRRLITIQNIVALTISNNRIIIMLMVVSVIKLMIKSQQMAKFCNLPFNIKSPQLTRSTLMVFKS